MYLLDSSTTSLISGGQVTPFFADDEDLKAYFKKCVQAIADGGSSVSEGPEQRQACRNVIKFAATGCYYPDHRD